MDRLRTLLCAACLVSSVLCTCALVSGQEAQEPAPAPVSGTEQAQAAADTPLEKFNAEMDLASKAPDRDSRVEHLRKALECRPNDPDNIRIEWQIGIELYQRYDPAFPDQVPIELEALKVFEGILQRYRHMDYYEFDPHDGGMRPELMMPHAAIQAAEIEMYINNDVQKAREHAYFAMDSLYETYTKRLADWRNEAAPVQLDPEIDRMGKSKMRYATWQERQKRAAVRDVLTQHAKNATHAWVQVFLCTFDHRNAEETRTALQVVQQRYPYSPLSKAADELIKEAEKADQEAAANTE